MDILSVHTMIGELHRQAAELASILITNNISVSVTESCTGGLFSHLLVSEPGISAVFSTGIVNYSWEAKMRELGISRAALEKYSAESPEIAEAMVRGIYKKTGSALCLSSTGVAGPGTFGGKPAGTLFTGILFRGDLHVYELETGVDDRTYNRMALCAEMLTRVKEVLSPSMGKNNN